MDGKGAPANGAAGGSDTERRRRLTRLAVEVERHRVRLAGVQAELGALAGREAAHPLDAGERRRLARLRLESEALRLEGAALRATFERLRGRPRPA